jgi:hypothetical protein
VIFKRSASDEFKNQSERPVLPLKADISLGEADITWIFEHLDEELRVKFDIDRKNPSCHTPRRNPEITATIESLKASALFFQKVNNFFRATLFSYWHLQLCQRDSAALSSIMPNRVFVPVLPILETSGKNSQKQGMSLSFLVGALYVISCIRVRANGIFECLP